MVSVQITKYIFKWYLHFIHVYALLWLIGWHLCGILISLKIQIYFVVNMNYVIPDVFLKSKKMSLSVCSVI